jgi:hypothetical protein
MDTDNDIPIEALQVMTDYKKIGMIVGIAVVILSGITIAAYSIAKGRSNVTVLPGGQTYLGPGREIVKSPTNAPVQTAQPEKFTASDVAQWEEHKGKVYPFTFTYPANLTMTTFTGDITDSVGIAWGSYTPQANILFRVSDINKVEPSMAKYIGKPEEYAKNWWTQYTGGLKGVKSLVAFTNSKGMKGYRVRFINQSDQTPNEDVFFEVPGRQDLMVRFGNGILDQTVFDRIIDSFNWTQ